MRRNYKVRAGIGAGTSTVLLTLAALTFVPGASMSKDAAAGVMVLGLLVAVPLMIVGLVQGALAKADKSTMWLAVRCLPGRVQAGLAVLGVAGAVLGGTVMGSPADLAEPQIRNGLYYAEDRSERPWKRIEISCSQYETIVRSDQRAMFTIPGAMLAITACLTLAYGELSRADAAAAQAHQAGSAGASLRL
ncbi:hypothetical protein [Streptomyces dysideae]|uniref:Uncharacterized protein n=1 Tax=Streptomyces dysideae TaxID=909626 RepID=A0A124IFQ8_9ACTN|nr:hypothetical protein [Streptomyces dysideae]KUO22232.1 hypothetical protein AQJ91_04445 [Streptomyces dysideae]